jgi:hypothetical protein
MADVISNNKDIVDWKATGKVQSLSTAAAEATTTTTTVEASLGRSSQGPKGSRASSS